MSSDSKSYLISPELGIYPCVLLTINAKFFSISFTVFVMPENSNPVKSNI